jgi:hypothetical protein
VIQLLYMQALDAASSQAEARRAELLAHVIAEDQRLSAEVEVRRVKPT